MKKVLVLFISILSLLFIIAILLLLFYFSQPQIDKRFLLKSFEPVPIYSSTGECDKISFSAIDNDFSYLPRVRCIYQDIFPAEKTIESYELSLTKDGWNCFSEDIHGDWYVRSYFKEGLRLNLIFFTNRKIDIGLSKNDNLAIGFNYSCLGASIKYPEPLKDKNGLQYTPSSYWEMNK